MSLSKVYKSTDTFQPEDIVRHKIKAEPVWESIIRPFSKSAQPQAEQRNGFQAEPSTPVFSPSPPKNAEEITSPQAAVPPPDGKKQETPDDLISANQPTPTSEQEIAVEQPVGIAPEVVKQMVAEAFDKGVQEGVQQAEEDFGSAAKSLLLLFQQLDHLRETILKNSAGEMQDLVMVIAEKIIRHSVQEQHRTILETVDEAIHKAVKSDEFYVFVNPADYDIVAEKSADLVAGMNGLDNLVVKKEANIERGGCRIESENCTVDATIVSQLEIIRNQIKKQQ